MSFHCVRNSSFRSLTIERVADFHKAHHAKQCESGQAADAKQNATKGIDVAEGFSV